MKHGEFDYVLHQVVSLPARGHGLKLVDVVGDGVQEVSLPARGRGLKH